MSTPRTKTRRRDLAQTIRNDLDGYKRMVRLGHEDIATRYLVTIVNNVNELMLLQRETNEAAE